MAYLLDTNVVSDLVRNPQGRVVEHVRRVGEANVCTSVIAAAELRFGAEKKGSLRLTRQLEAVLDALEILPFEVPADVVYGEIRARLEGAGRPDRRQRPVDRRPCARPRPHAGHRQRVGVRSRRRAEVGELAEAIGDGRPPAIAVLAVKVKPLRGR